MKDYYKNLRLKIDAENENNVDEEDNELETILQTLKPNTTAENFKEFLLPRDNNTRTQAWRKIGRDVYSKEQKKKKEMLYQLE
jgi:hypothetical protein